MNYETAVVVLLSGILTSSIMICVRVHTILKCIIAWMNSRVD